ncbi:MAG: SDR family oxidoreductase [Dehalococcoidia bacterium]|nr:SDR family oxidoreductase [Dehalococcoidia bacterium]
MGKLDGKVAVITGGASGIGAATARLFAAEGARVLIADLQHEVAEQLAATLPDAAAVRCNVAREDDVRAAVEAAVSRWGGLDIMFNNAGFGGASGPIEETTVEEYDMTMDVLLKSVFLGTKYAAPHLRARGGGAIVNTASVCSFEAGVGNQLYSVAKAGVVMMTQAAAIELAEHGIRVNAVCPGYVATSLPASRPRGEYDAEEVEAGIERVRGRFADMQPIPRAGEAEDVANAVLFLASDDAAWITGESLVIDGGLLAGRPWRKLSGTITKRREIALYRPR